MGNMRRLRLAMLRLARSVGLFAAARWLCRHQARIVCYHGFAYRDEHKFVPQLFMAPATFERRLALLQRSGLVPVSLDTLVTRLEQGAAVSGLLAITVDDGWSGFARFAWPQLKASGMPCTLYLTTWYADKGWPVLNVLRRYLEWHRIDLPAETPNAGVEFEQLRRAANEQGLDLQCEDGALFRLSRLDEVHQMVTEGLDVQLHTHRHRMPMEASALCAELQDNRMAIAQASPGPAVHLCYPSGDYQASQIPHLQSCGVRSATTTRLGLVSRKSDRWQLPRLLDSDQLDDIEFEAELCGFLSLARAALRRQIRPQPRRRAA
jgi:peptidoglycan/xylan/chitin deacetylase (PgdA/CDA1 family)